MSVILTIGTALPRHCFAQKQLAEFMADLFQLAPKEKRALRIMYAKSGIDHRYSAIFLIAIFQRTLQSQGNWSSPETRCQTG